MQRWIGITLGLAAGCTCGEPGRADGGIDTGVFADAASLDATRSDAVTDVGVDAWAPDAWVPDRLILREIDPTPCAPASPQPRRSRGLPADPTPRVLWSRSYTELGLDGTTYNAGSVDRAGNLSLDTHWSVAEVGRDGALRGVGALFTIDKGYYGPTMSLVDGSSAQFVLDAIRIDSDPPDSERTETLAFESLSPIGVDFQELAATSDGGFYAQRASHGALRKYCGDGRLQWELLGVEHADGMMVEADDSVWLPGGTATEHRPVRIDVRGGVLEEIALLGAGWSRSCRCRTSSTEIEARNPGRSEVRRSSPRGRAWQHRTSRGSGGSTRLRIGRGFSRR